MKFPQVLLAVLNQILISQHFLILIYYYNILNDRQNNTEAYKKIVEILSEYLRYDEEGNKRVYVPAVISIIDGKIIGFDDESSYDTLGYDDPKDYWTEDRKENLKKRLTEMISKVADNKCSDCNK